MRNSLFTLSGLFLLLTVLIVSSASGQELEPRAYWVSPVGTNGVYFGYAHSRGDFVADPSLPVEDVDTRLNSSFIGYYRSINFFNRSANLTLTVPYYWGTIKGFLEGEFQKIRRSGTADLQMRFSANLLGGRAMTISEYQEFRENPETIVGVSVRIQPPTGQYDPNKNVNLGTNRWAFKPQIGLIQPIKRKFIVELSLGTWFYTENKNFSGATRKQDPLITGEFHFIWRIRPAFWASLDSTYYYGGRTKINLEPRLDIQRNSRFGGTFAIPFRGRHIIKFSVSSGFFVSFGGAYDSFSISYQYGWLSGQ